MKKYLILIFLLLLTQFSMATDLAPTGVKIVSQNSNIAWLKFKDNSDGDLFRVYFDGKPNNVVISDRKDTKHRNGKSRVFPLKVNKLAPNKTYKVTVGVIKDNKKVAESKAFDLTVGDSTGGGNNNQAPKIVKVFKGSNRYTWVRFIDNSNGDFFRFYFNGKENKEAIKDYKDTTSKNGKSRVVPINTTKLAPNSKFNVTIGVIKDNKKIAESKPFTLKTGDDVNLTKKVIEAYRGSADLQPYQYNMIKVDFYLDEHLAVATDLFDYIESAIKVYRIDDNNNITYLESLNRIYTHTKLPQIVHMFHKELREGFTFIPFDNDKKLKVDFNTMERRYSYTYDIRDLDNIIFLEENTEEHELNLEEKVIAFSAKDDLVHNRITVGLYADNHLAMIQGHHASGAYFIDMYMIDDNQNITHTDAFDTVIGSDGEFSPGDHEGYYFEELENSRLKILATASWASTTYIYDIHDLDNITLLSTDVVDH